MAMLAVGHRRGGVALGGPPLGATDFAWYLPSARRVKRWLEQAEMLIAILAAYQLTGGARCLAAFEKQFDWIWRFQIDHEQGDLFEATDEKNGRPLSFVKSHEWKEPYHGTRALMQVSRRLSVVAGGS